jgi:ElaB/YqjD/DUF883 family membrane-anchored ribosome-binding protein
MESTYKNKDYNNSNAERMSEHLGSATQQGEQKLKMTAAEIERKLKQGEEQLKRAVSSVDKQLHDNPWPVVAGVAVGCLLIGFLAGSRR